MERGRRTVGVKNIISSCTCSGLNQIRMYAINNSISRENLWGVMGTEQAENVTIRLDVHGLMYDQGRLRRAQPEFIFLCTKMAWEYAMMPLAYLSIFIAFCGGTGDRRKESISSIGIWRLVLVSHQTN